MGLGGSFNKISSNMHANQETEIQMRVFCQEFLLRSLWISNQWYEENTPEHMHNKDYIKTK